MAAGGVDEEFPLESGRRRVGGLGGSNGRYAETRGASAVLLKGENAWFPLRHGTNVYCYKHVVAYSI